MCNNNGSCNNTISNIELSAPLASSVKNPPSISEPLAWSFAENLVAQLDAILRTLTHSHVSLSFSPSLSQGHTDGRAARPAHFRSRGTVERPSRGNARVHSRPHMVPTHAGQTLALLKRSDPSLKNKDQPGNRRRNLYSPLIIVCDRNL